MTCFRSNDLRQPPVKVQHDTLREQNGLRSITDHLKNSASTHCLVLVYVLYMRTERRECTCICPWDDSPVFCIRRELKAPSSSGLENRFLPCQPSTRLLLSATAENARSMFYFHRPELHILLLSSHVQESKSLCKWILECFCWAW